MTSGDNCTLRTLDGVRPLYLLPTDPLAEDVLIPGFQNADNVDCMVGFFTSDVLASLAPGLATYINSTENRFRLIVSPLLRSEDQAAIADGAKSADEVATKIVEELIITEDLIQQHTLRCLSWLLRKNRIEIRVALMKGALFHPKVWLFDDNENTIAAHGSCNVTYSGIRKNIEQIAISCSWQDPTQRYITNKLRYQFDRLWKNREDICVVIRIPEAIRQRILHTYSSESPPTENDLQGLYERATRISEGTEPYRKINIHDRKFKIPDYLRYEDGPFGHQGKAVSAWCDSGHRGILEMATGSGKTITAMICAQRLYETEKPLLIVVSAPYVPLIEQWCDEIAPFGVKPINLTRAGSATRRSAMLQKLNRRMRTGLSNVEAVVVSHDTLCSDDFSAAVNRLGCSRLLIGDEVHNLGRASFIDHPPEFFEHRLGLSATPIRQYDQEGTDALLKFFRTRRF